MNASYANRELLRRLLALAWAWRWWCLLLLALSGLSTLASLAALRLLGLGIDHLRHALSGQPTHWPWGLHPPADWSLLATLGLIAGGLLAVSVLGGGLRFLHAEMSSRIMQGRIVVDLRHRVYDKLQRLSFRFFDAHQSGAIINRLTSDVQGLREFIEAAVLQFAVAAVTLVVALGWMLSVHVGLTLATLVFVPFMVWRTLIFAGLVKHCYQASRDRQDELVRHLVESVHGIHVIKAFGLEDSRQASFDQRNDALSTERNGIFGQVSAIGPIVYLLAEAGTAVQLGFGGWLVMSGRLDLGAGLIVCMGLYQQFTSQLTQMTTIANRVADNLACAGRVFTVLDAPIEVASPPAGRMPARTTGRIELRDVSFAYRPERPVLRGLNLDIQAGECLAILGPTGSGKSTLLSLIPRFYDPLHGQILLDGCDLRELDLSALRRQVGVVFQETFLFSTTIAANIAFGCPGATPAQVEAAARLADAHDFICSLPQGYDTIVGERGCNLSGGQRQRLAIARAVLTDPRILLLDDATAAVDPETEGEVLDAIEAASTGRTTIIVAHRLGTLRRADRVVVLERGRIAQIGTHTELMASDGHYRRSAEVQGHGS